MGLIPEDTVSEIRARADLTQVIGRHVKLTKAGRNFKGLCPFHGEKTPSFSVNPERGFYYCFGCQAKGDVFSFVMEYEGKSFVEAAESLAAEFGITIPETVNVRGNRDRGLKTQMLEVNAAATEFYEECLKTNSDAAAYLKSRGTDRETQIAFRLGYAPAEWGALADHLHQRGVSLKIAEKVGLVVPKKSGRGYYDRFRDRLMCPIILTGGEVVGFSGRQLREDGDHSGAKYINSPESPLYKKSRLLFGLHLARQGFRDKDRAILVEGNFDVVSLHQEGFAETVAPLGTALTDEQAAQIRRLTERVVLLYDGDKAGRAAAFKSLSTLSAADLDVKIALVPDGEDPDGLARSGGKEALKKVIDGARPAFEYFIYEVWGQSQNSADSRAKALDQAAELIARLKNPTKRDFVVGMLTSAMGVDVGVIRRAVQRSSSKNRSEDSRGGYQRSSQRGGYGQRGSSGNRQSGAQGHPNAPGGARQARSGQRSDPRSAGRSSAPAPMDDPRSAPPIDDADRGRQDAPPHFGSDEPPPIGDENFASAGPAPSQETESKGYSPPARTRASAFELDLLALLSDHPKLMEAAEEKGVFSLLTSSVLRDMYSAARTGQPMLSAIPVDAEKTMTSELAQRLMAGSYAAVSDPPATLTRMVARLTAVRKQEELKTLQQQRNDARRRGNRDLERQLSRQILETRKALEGRSA